MSVDLFKTTSKTTSNTTSKAIGAVGVLAALGFALGGCALPPAQLPEDNGRQLTALDQSWTPDERMLYYHDSQGSVLMPYPWLMALEQPEIKFVGEVGLFLDDDYVGKFGFLPGRPVPGRPELPKDCTPSADPNDVDYTCGLPVGFSRTLLDVEALSLPGILDRDTAGLTCAACHTGELHHAGNAIRIDGGTSLMDPTNFQSALGMAVLLTERLPFRMTRFADRVLGKPQPPAAGSPDFKEQFERYKAELEAYDVTFDDKRDALRDDLGVWIKEKFAEQITASRKGLYDDYPGGFGRTDALARIANITFGTEMGIDDNLVVGSAPVKFPALWDAPYFDWSQFNGSIEQPMTRNIGEALGVRAKVHFAPTDELWEVAPGESGDEGLFEVQSTVDVPGLFAIERLLRGEQDDYFSGLRSPIWPEALFGSIEWPDARDGKALYEQRCAHCHMPPIAELVERDAAGKLVPRSDLLPPLREDGTRPDSGGSGNWVSNNADGMIEDLAAGPWPQQEWFLSLGTVDLGTIGTDPGQAANFARNIVDTKHILLPKIPKFSAESTRDVPVEKRQYPERVMPAGVGLQKVTIAISEGYYDWADARIAAEGVAAYADTLPRTLRDADGSPIDGLLKDGKIDRDFWNGYLSPGAIVAARYAARPLNGIWASPPFLHNGAVPTLYALLSPLAERPEVFYTGSRAFDVDKVGYRTDKMRGLFKFDTRVTGNSNDGHRFEAGPRGNGIIGGAYDDGQRRKIIEYLKTLCPPGTWTDYTAEVLCGPNPPAAEPAVAEPPADE